ncbi:AAA family ATPase [Fructilactobacillus sanfranciscensis]|uniref:AAA family ATPase n=1 Tax=Fructilactobacillus sanfranciscensis TaxID=1625 RepID=UPI0031F912E7
MNFKNVSLKEFILTGLASNYLVTEESLEKITKKIIDYSYDKESIKIDLDYLNDYEKYIDIVKKRHAINIFLKLNAIKINKKYLNNETKLVVPEGLYKIKSNNSSLIDRKKELTIINVLLNKKGRSNVLLVGEPGVGKTHLVSNLDNNIMFVDLSGLISGTACRGSFESKLKEIIKFSVNNKVILFIDEIHSLFNLGLSEGGISALNILKPYLSSGQITVIGATTPKELKILYSDMAFLRRFTLLNIRPISKKEIISNSDVLLKEFSINLTNGAICKLVNKSIELFGDDRALDGFLDMVDTANSYFKNHKNIEINELKLDEIDFIWREIYDPDKKIS